MELFELIQTLNTAHGPSGDEGAVREVIAALARPHADEVTADTLGNLIVRKRGSGPKVMLCAHMDSTGLIVTHIGKEGFLRVGTLGGIAARELLYTPVRFKNGVRGVIVPEEKAEFGKLKLDACYVDIGAKDEEQARRMVQVGDTAVYDTAIFLSGDKVVSPYLDNRISCAVLLRVLEELDACPNDLYLVFSAQEEVGLRGARTAAWSIDPDYALAVDVTDVDDTPGSEKLGTVRLGQGAAVKVMDRSVICTPAVCAALEQAGADCGVATQREILQFGGTDTAALQKTRAGVQVGAVSIPTRYIHSPSEMCAVSDVEGAAKLLAGFAVGQN